MLDEGVDSQLLVVRKHREKDETIIQMVFLRRMLISLWRLITKQLLKLQKSHFYIYRSLNIFPTGNHRVINKISPDIVQMHWINQNTISIGEITKIDAPVIWKLPDMWGFCGTEHYVDESNGKRYRDGYTKNNRNKSDKGMDIDRMVWQYKKMRWRNHRMTIVCPSKWLASRARESELFKNYKIVNIMNPLDIELFKPSGDRSIRKKFGLPESKKIILFGSLLAIDDRRKGYHHLLKSISHLEKLGLMTQVELAIFGTESVKKDMLSGLVSHHLGTIRNESDLVSLYSTCDVLVLPTEADNLPNVVKEAMACGTPCVGFNVGGMPDMITHQVDGYLAKPFDSGDLVEGILWVLGQPDEIRQRVRESAILNHDPAARVNDYLSLYEQVLS